ncbi:MAG: AAA family ATPase [Cellulomonadaceae bacterium]|nr:AAA family ATPase [Cellulomonadaceae bacterium]
MTTRFRVEAVELITAGGPVRHAFDSDLTVLAGPTGVGKTTLLELIKFGLGGDGLLAPVARDNVEDVSLTIRAGAQHLRLARSTAPALAATIRVTDLVTGERIRDRSVGGPGDTISGLLMEALGLPVGLLAAARGGRSTSAGSEITFNDLFRFMYIPQAEINKDIAHSTDGYYDPKRKSLFELLFGLTSEPLLAMRSQINVLKANVDSASAESAAVNRFLADSGTTDRITAESRALEARKSESDAASRLEALRADLEHAMDDRTRALRRVLGRAEAASAEAEGRLNSLAQEERDYLRERSRVERDIAKFERMAAAGHQMAAIDFLICPRCTQSLVDREVEPGRCPVCTLPDPVDFRHGSVAHDEAEQLRGEVVEIDVQLAQIRADLNEVATALASRRELVAGLSLEVNVRTEGIITPQLQAYADTAATIERSRAELAALELILQQWDRAEDLAARAEALAVERARLQLEVREAEIALRERRSSVLNALSEEFARTVADFGIPSVTSATIDEMSYLPLLNGQPFGQVSRAGGIITATQIAYWLAVVTTAIRLRDTLLPTFLMIDSPRLALNNQERLAQQMYRRFVTQVDANPGLAQFIVADNELPREYGTEFREIRFDYTSPTVPTVPHPGLAGVDLLATGDEPPEGE